LQKFDGFENWKEAENTLTCLANISGVTLYMLSPDGQIQGIISQNPCALELYRVAYQRIKKIFESVTFNFPSFLSEAYGVSFFTVKTPYGILLCGPVIHISIKEPSYAEQFEDCELSVTEKLRYIESFAFTPVIDYIKFVELGLIISNLINKKDISFEQLIIKRQLFFFKDAAESFDFNGEKYITSFPFEVIIPIMEAVLSGEALQLTNTLKKISGWELNSAKGLSLRSYRLNFAMLAGVIMSECVNAGLDETLASRLCEYYIDWFGRSRTVEEIIGVFLKMLYDYADRFYKKRNNRVSKLSSQFEKYVFSKMSERISLSQAASMLNVSPQYLCRKIKEDFGVSPNKLIHKTKIQEAKRLLKARRMPLSDVWLHLGYCDQSHFNKVFKEYSGMTPGEYLLKVG